MLIDYLKILYGVLGKTGQTGNPLAYAFQGAEYICINCSFLNERARRNRPLGESAVDDNREILCSLVYMKKHLPMRFSELCRTKNA